MVAPLFEIQARPVGAAAVRLTRTPQGWQVFELVFFSSMSSTLRSFVLDCLDKGKDKPINEEEASGFDLIFNGLIQRLEAEPDLVTLIADKCDTGNGVQALSVLRSKFAGNTPAKSLTVLYDMFNTKLDADTLDGAQRIPALNEQLAADKQFPPKLLSAFILHKLPGSFSNLRDKSIAAGVYPCC